MRWLLAILLLLNGVVFYWFAGQSSQPVVDAGISRAERDIGGLLLLSERPEVDVEEPVEEALCVVVGPIADLSFQQWLGEELSYREIEYGAWSEMVTETGDLPPIERYWLQFPVSRRDELSEQLWLDIESSSPESKIEEKTCSVVASDPDIP